MWLILVLTLVIFIGIKVFLRLKGTIFPDSQVLEVTWTVIPIIILLRIAFPSIFLLCVQDSIRQSPNNSLKIVSNQWNWQRESLESVDHLLDSDRIDLISSYESPILIVNNKRIRILTIRTDVLHSLGIPSLGIKLDAAPGRIRITILESSIPGVFLGSCYELCGSGHRAIPIHLVCV